MSEDPTIKSKDPGDPNKRAQEIKDFVARALFDQAINRITDFARDFCPNNFKIEKETLVLKTYFHLTLNHEQTAQMTLADIKGEYIKLAEKFLDTLIIIKKEILAAILIL